MPIKFRADAPPRVRIEARPDNDGWLFSVKDNGKGIDEVFQTDVFRLFHRLEGRPDSSGTGTGLAIVRRIIQQYHGRIWFESRAGEGTTFFIWLPATTHP